MGEKELACVESRVNEQELQKSEIIHLHHVLFDIPLALCGMPKAILGFPAEIQKASDKGGKKTKRQ